jgi:hypothetical protein
VLLSNISGSRVNPNGGVSPSNPIRYGWSIAAHLRRLSIKPMPTSPADIKNHMQSYSLALQLGSPANARVSSDPYLHCEMELGIYLEVRFT